MRVRLYAIGCCLMLSACGTAKTLVIDAPASKASYRNIELVEHASTVDVPVEIRDKFKEYLKKEIYEKAAFAEGREVTLEYRFLQVNEGSRFARWFLGGLGNAGEATMTIQAVYKVPGNEQFAKVQVEGKIGSGFFGGSMDSALEKAAEDIGRYTVTTFR